MESKLNTLNDSTYRDAEKFVEFYIKSSKLKLQNDGSFKEDGDLTFTSTSLFFSRMWTDYIKTWTVLNAEARKNDRPKFHQFKESDLRKVLDLVIVNEKTNLMKEMATKYNCVKEDLDPIREFVKVATGSANELETMVIAHTIWQVKRKMNSLPVYDHMMAILHSETQGTGKSTIINKLLDPIKNYTLNLRLDEVTDSRFYLAFQDNFVVFCDEMGGSERASVEILKQQITNSVNTVRLFHTQNTVKAVQNCTFIAASNRSLVNLIYDSTGTRRFFQINCCFMDREAMDKLDMEALWRGVDETRNVPYTRNFEQQIKALQADSTVNDPIADFIEDMEIATPLMDEGKSVFIPSSTLAGAVKAWNEMNDSSIKARTVTLFLRSKGIKITRAYVGNVQTRGIYVKEGSKLDHLVNSNFISPHMLSNKSARGY